MIFNFYLPIYLHWISMCKVIRHSNRPTNSTKKYQISCMHAMYVDIDENARKTPNSASVDIYEGKKKTMDLLLSLFIIGQT
jgi:hypothetical protein